MPTSCSFLSRYCHDSNVKQYSLVHLVLLAGFGIEALCMYFLGFINMGTPALVFLTVGVGGSGLTISGT